MVRTTGSDGKRVWLGRCELGGCCLEKGHAGECNDGNMSDQEYEVECITAEKVVRKRKLYLVKWRGWPEEDSTWENEAALVDAKECLEEWKESGRQQKRRLKKTAIATPAAPKLTATMAEVIESEEKEVVVLTDTEAEETEAAAESEADEEADKTDPVSPEEVEARTDKAAAGADAHAAAAPPQVVPSSMTTSPVQTLSELQADADVWLNVLEEVALLREGVQPKRTYNESTFVAHTLPFQALQLVSQVCKAWRIDEATPRNARIWKALCERRWPSVVQMDAPCDHRALFKMLSQPLGRFEMALGEDYMPYGPDVFGKKRIKFDPEMQELQEGFHATFKELKKSKQVDYVLKSENLADVTLLVDIHTTGGAHLLSRALRGSPTVRLTYKPKYDFSSLGLGPPKPEPGEVCLWTFVTPLPPGWDKVEKKVSCSLVNPRVGKARLILDRQTESDFWYDMTKPTEENLQERRRFQKSYGGQDAPALESSEEMDNSPLLNIEEADGNLTISLYAVGADQAAGGYPLGLLAWLEPIRQSGLAPADPRRLPTPPRFGDYSEY